MAIDIISGGLREVKTRFLVLDAKTWKGKWYIQDGVQAPDSVLPLSDRKKEIRSIALPEPLSQCFSTFLML